MRRGNATEVPRQVCETTRALDSPATRSAGRFAPAVSFLFPSQTITFDAALRDLASGSPKARASAARALGDVDGETERRRAIDALVRALDDDKPEVRAAACASLGTLGELTGVPGLIKRLDDGAPPVRQNAAIALGTLRAADGFEPLADALRSGPADLRFQAATSLAEIDPQRAFPHVVSALGDRDAQVVGAAALSVGAIASVHGEHKAVAIAALGDKVDHADRGARFEVAYALAELDDARGTKILADGIPDAERSWDAVTALGRLRAESELMAALAHKKTTDEARTLAAGRVLAITDAPKARKVLTDALMHRKVHVRGIALEQLAEIGGAWARPALDKLAKSIKGSELGEPIGTAMRAIAEREGQ
jgi:HEAT repeat protein